MNQVLIINLRKNGDVFMTANLIRPLIKSSPHLEIHMLVYEDSLQAALTLKNVHKVHVIRRKELLTLYSSRLFSNGFALEEFYNSIEPIKKISWSQVVNFSNDLVSTYLTSYFKKNKVCGLSLNKEGAIQYSNRWNLFLNDAITGESLSPVHFHDIYLNMAHLSEADGQSVRISNQNNETVQENIQKIRKNHENRKKDLKIVGLQIKSGSENKDIPKSTLVELIDKMLESENYLPILLIAPIEKERDFANQLNEVFNNELICVESDFLALASVLSNIDAIVTPDTSVKHMADLVGVPMLEVSLGESPMYKQGSVKNGNLILTTVPNGQGLTKFVSSSSIFNSLGLLVLKGSTVPTLERNHTLYKVTRDELGVWYKAAAGDIHVKTELDYHIGRIFFGKLFCDNSAEENLDYLTTSFSSSEINDWISTEKEEITLVVKNILNVLRVMKSNQNVSQKREQFTRELNNLLKRSQSKRVTRYCVKMMQGKLETISSNSLDQNIKEVELILYGLKNEIQLLNTVLTNIEETLFKKKQMEYSKKQISV